MTRKEWNRKNGFSNFDNVTYCIYGENTYAIKDFLKDSGCKFNPILKWHNEYLFDLPEGYHFYAFSFDDLYIWEGEDAIFKPEAKYIVEKAIKTAEGPDTHEYYPGEVGDKINFITAVVKNVKGYMSYYGWQNIYTFETGKYLFVWFTVKDLYLKKNDLVDITSAIIKDFKEYKGQKTTQIKNGKIVLIERES